MRYQNETIACITNILKTISSYDDFGYSMRALIDNYSNHYELKSGKVLTVWWNCLSNKYIELIKKHLIISSAALEILNKNLTVAEYKKLLRFEHMTPMAFTKSKLKDLKHKNNISEETVAECFKYANVILLTKEESNILDNNRIEVSDVDKFGLVEDATEERNLIGKKLDRTGSGLFRLFYLVDKGIKLTVDQKELTDQLEYYKIKEHKLY